MDFQCWLRNATITEPNSSVMEETFQVNAEKDVHSERELLAEEASEELQNTNIAVVGGILSIEGLCTKSSDFLI